MKALIWIVCVLVYGIIESIFMLGAIPATILFGCCILWLPRFLCRKWDNYKLIKETQKGSSHQSFESCCEDDDQIQFCRKCGERLINNSLFCRNCGTKVVKE